MTVSELKALTQDTITPAVAARVLGCDPQWIRITARENRESLGFPVVVLGHRVKIPRVAFIKFMEGAR